MLRQQLEFYNNDPSSDRISQVKNELADVKDVMVQSIERVMERGERIELLVDKTDRLNQTSFKFEKSSKQLKDVRASRILKNLCSDHAANFLFGDNRPCTIANCNRI